MRHRKASAFVPHLERYVWALPYCQNKRVLDAGAKDGYGAHLISGFANFVTLADRNEAWLKEAQHNYKYMCPVETVIVDFDSDFPKDNWDVVVAFEVIEHVADPDFFVKNISEHLTSGGLLLFSVPHMIENPDHKTLFDEENIKNLISKYLKIEEFYIQDKYGISGKSASCPPRAYAGVAKKI